RVARRVEAGDRLLVVGGDDLRVLVDAQPALGVERAGTDLQRVERRRVERAERGVRQVVRVAPLEVPGIRAAVEVGVLAARGVRVEALHGRGQPGRVDPELGREVGERLAL